MKKLLKLEQKISMVPQDIKGALSSKIKKIMGSCIDLEVKDADMPYYKKGGTVEMFTIVDDGMLYFKPVVKEIDDLNKVIKVEFNREKYELLQRREFTRIDFQKEFTLKDDTKEYVCVGIDIGAGGMKFATEAALTTSQDYPIEFTLEGSIPIQCFFKPIRVDREKGKSTKNIVSGRFIALKNIDKIAIVQFCFKKQMESTNK